MRSMSVLSLCVLLLASSATGQGLGRGLRVRGELRRAQFEPWPHATVDFLAIVEQERPELDRRVRVRADAEGRFELRLSAAQRWRAHAWSTSGKGEATRVRYSRVSEIEPGKRLVLQACPDASTRVRVWRAKPAKGQPEIAALRVVDGSLGDPFGPAMLRTQVLRFDAEGSLLLPAIPARFARVQALDAELRPLPIRASIDLSEDFRKGPEFTLESADCELLTYGVLDAKGEPIPDARIEAVFLGRVSPFRRTSLAVTGARGQFSVWAEAKRYAQATHLKLLAAGFGLHRFAAARSPVAKGKQVVAGAGAAKAFFPAGVAPGDLKLQPARTLRGRLALGGQAAAGVTLALACEAQQSANPRFLGFDSKAPFPRVWTKTGVDGSFALSHLPKGSKWELFAYPTPSLLAVLTAKTKRARIDPHPAVHLASGYSWTKLPDRLEISLDRVEAIVLRDERGAAELALSEIAIWRRAPEAAIVGRFDRRGRFAFLRVPDLGKSAADGMQLFAVRPQCAVRAALTELASTELDRRLVFPEPRDFRIRVLDGAREERSDAKLSTKLLCPQSLERFREVFGSCAFSDGAVRVGLAGRASVEILGSLLDGKRTIATDRLKIKATTKPDAELKLVLPRE